ncbi:MAG TPA: sigma-70 family RNA polymerase sigma factor [Vicinamibacterales bacterium]
MDDLTRLLARSGAARWGVSAEAFALVLERCLSRFNPSTAADRARLVESLHLEDLALAAGCIAGNDAAWEHFIREFRPALYQAARTIAGDEGRELADSLYAELYGLVEADGTRKSLLAWYHGRSRLVTWLRSVLVQRRIDRVRATRRLQPLDENVERTATSAERAPDPERARLVALAQQALDAAIDALPPGDRLRLRLYYGQSSTLRDIGRLTREHEATVSRKLEKARRSIRAAVEAHLQAAGLNRDQIRLCLEYASEAPELELDRLLREP